MTERIEPNLFSIKVNMPNNPLRYLNSYLIKGEKRNLLIDTGFNQPESLHDLASGLSELQVDMKDTDIFITHYHSDHCGLVPKIAHKCSKIYMSVIDKEILLSTFIPGNNSWEKIRVLFLREGCPDDEIIEILEKNPARSLRPDKPFDITGLCDDEILQIGDIKLRCILTPGHTAGHMCLYWEERSIIFTGDHVLFDVTPNIANVGRLQNGLACYFESLKRVKELSVRVALPAHRESTGGFVERVDSILLHHHQRLDEIVRIIAENPGLTCYEITGRMKWSIRAKGWEDFPSSQKFFAIGEAWEHLVFLVNENMIRREFSDGKNIYYPIS